ncbi:MAG: heme exporter protein CcmB [Bacteroidetes bacterium]|nr:heme exporter protein CcmB [Bacteroidota bacterium]
MLKQLVVKEFKLEFRQKSTIAAVILYVAGTVFISALSFKIKPDKPTWNALFWITYLFTGVTVSGKSFLKETGGQALFNYSYYSPHHFIFGKIIYNMIFLSALNFILWLLFLFFLGDAVDNKLFFFIVLELSTIGLSASLTLMSAIAAKANSGFGLISILSFPVVTPLLLASIKAGKQAVDGIEWAGVNFNNLIVLLALSIISILLALILFPFIWKE